MATEYESYTRDEWALFFADPSRAQASRQAVEGIRVARVLDIGCGAAQELVPFLASPSVLGIGLDSAPEVGFTKGDLDVLRASTSRVAFVRARAEGLPFLPGSFDLVTCRLALPYFENHRALSEIARVLRVEGALLLKYHHARYYFRQLVHGLADRRWPTVRNSLTVLFFGSLYHVTGWQSADRQFKEVFQTARSLRRQLAACGLVIRAQMPDSNPLTPSWVIIRTAVTRRTTVADN